MKTLEGKIAVVAGATRGAGRAIAVALGEAGATVYCTGRSVKGKRSDLNRPETIDETAEMVTAAGGIGIAVQVDHTVESQVQELFKRIGEEQQGRLDILVNDIWGGDQLIDWKKPFWEHSLDKGLLVQDRAVRSHMYNSYYAAPLMVERGSGLIIEVTDGTGYNYRGNLYYSLAKVSAIHLAAAMATDLQATGVTALCVTPGFLRSEEMLEHFKVTEANWQDAVHSGIPDAEHFGESETPYLLARGVAKLAADPKVGDNAGKTLASWDLSETYGYTDVDGRSPHWGRYAKKLGIYQGE
ncbi:SDR family oxidoreductase [Paenibacillus radicis (ex Gao et al. 2016)]|uniref:Short-chain dehydrogenase n=1 Tax=Paenibacillus radicis (ex Gao et al. 2016) TaxID=1737354 RepID=A0A917H567_9BACL|nr:SDR family oxidoreductase [Paenibacillus radicis (ex Gao et al. 2016)]GGG67948.1 short-chain dehydrogenase [Paenibacillus radicis (ex Gao et al. 2016)]